MKVNHQQSQQEVVFDAFIVGAGPASLATLSALHSPYNIDSTTMTESQVQRAIRRGSSSSHSCKPLNVCVVDTHPNWMHSWQDNFEKLDIEFLRSPALAHPNLFDPNALLCYAVQHGREKEELLESGCADMRRLLALGQSQVGLWKLPSTRLFYDFCMDLASQLPHTFIGETHVCDIQRVDNDDSTFCLTTDKGQRIMTKAVILALGSSTYRPIIPKGIATAPRKWLWNNAPSNAGCSRSNGVVLVVGGGLTAVQVALQQVRRRQQEENMGKAHHCPQVVLVSRGPLKERHFDIGVDWFDHRTTNKCMADFFHLPIRERLYALKQARQGGSIPPIYLEQVRRAVSNGQLQCLVGQVEYDKSAAAVPTINEPQDAADDKSPMPVRVIHSKDGSETILSVKEIILACGVQPTSAAKDTMEKKDWSKSSSPTSLVDMIQSHWPVSMHGGLPSVTQDLRWKEGLDIFVVGSLGALHVGPDAGNLMGIRRAAQIVANALGCRTWLRETALQNPFDVLGWSSDEDDDDSSCASSVADES